MLNLSLIHQAPVRIRSLLSLVLLLALAGCAAPPPPPAITTGWDIHQQALQGLSQYRAKGKIGYKGPEQRFSASLLWQQQSEQAKLQLTNFLGQTLLKLEMTPQQATLKDNEGKTYSSHDAATLVRQLTGINMPVEQMKDWLIGLPTAADTYQLDENQRVAYLAKQLDDQYWELEYQEYDFSTTPSLPKKLILSQDTQRITLQLSDWEITNE